MKKFTFFWRYLTLMIMLFGVLSVGYADNREISGSVTSTSDYISCGTTDVDFNLTFESPDWEWGWELTLTFPEVFTINSAMDINGNAAVITGHEIYWPMNFMSSSESVDFTINLSADEMALGDQEFDYLIEGDGWGSDPHSFSGTAVIMEDPNTNPRLEIIPAFLDLGMWPIGAWQENVYFELTNSGSGQAVVTASELDDLDRAFLLEDVSLPASVTNCGDPLMVGIAMDPDAANVDGTTYNAVYVASWGNNRSVATADVQVTAYEPVLMDVFENPGLINVEDWITTPRQFVGESDREFDGKYKNYILPNDLVAADNDWVYKITAEADVFLDISVTAGVNIAIYAEDFSGEPGPMATNALFQNYTEIIDFPMFEGDYYVVFSAVGFWMGSLEASYMTAPAGVTYTVPPTPFDGELDIINTDDLEWTYNDVDAIEYRVVLGTTYPPTDVVMPWTAINSLGDTYELMDLEPNLQYFWRVDVQNNVGVTEGDVWGFTTTITPAQNVMAANEEIFEGDDVVLTWESPIDAARALLGYNVYRDGVKINDNILTGLTFTDDDSDALVYNMANPDGYMYTVTSVFDEGESGPSTPAVEVWISGNGTLMGNVSDISTTLDIEGAIIDLEGVDEFLNEVTYQATTDASGNYTIDLKAGVYDVAVSAHDYVTEERTPVTILWDATTTEDFILYETPFALAYVIATELDDDEVHLEWGFDLATFVPTHFPFDTQGLSNAQIEKYMIDYLSSNGVANADEFSMDAVADANRELVNYDIYRGLWDDDFVDMTLVGSSTQTQFIDYDWGIQTTGVYKWAVVVNYSDNQSVPTYSDPFLDKDMETVANVEVTLNSAESPAGTTVTLTNTSEPYLELEYTTILGETGMFVFDPIRKGIYDVEVSLWGYQTIVETDILIETETDLTYLLDELLISPNDFYVNPNGYATWSGAIIPYQSFTDENFDTGIPDDWTIVNTGSGSEWMSTDGTHGGWWSGTLDGTDYIIGDSDFSGDVFTETTITSPIMNTVGQVNTYLEFDEFWNTGWSADAIGILSVFDGTDWIELVLHDFVIGDIGDFDTPNHQMIDVSMYQNANFQVKFYYAATFDYWWAVDNVKVHNGGVRASRELQNFRVWLDGVVSGEPTEEYWDYEVEETLEEGIWYEAALASIYTTGISPEVYYLFKYHACDFYNPAVDFTAIRVEGTMDIDLAWTNDDTDVETDVFLGTNIYRNGEMYAFVEAGTEMFTDEEVASGTYEYCITQLYQSEAQSCEVCATETMTSGGFVNGYVTDYPNYDPIEGATVALVGESDSYVFTTDDAGYYEGEVVEGTYYYNVSAPEFESQILEDVLIDFGVTIVNDFALLQYPYSVGEVIAWEVDDDAVQVSWDGQGGGPTVGEWLTYDDGVNWNALGNETALTMSWAIRFEPAQLIEFEGSAITKVDGYIGEAIAPTSISVRIWAGADAGTLLYEEDVTSQVVFDDWNEFTLSSAVPFDNTEELWIGFYGEADGESYPAGLSNTAPANSKGDLYNSGSGWLHASDLGAGDLIFNLSAYVTNDYGTRIALNSRKAPSDYKVSPSIPQPTLTVSQGLSYMPKTLDMNNSSRETILYEDFSSQSNNVDIDLPGWLNDPTVGTRVWRGKTYSGNVYAQCTSYNSDEENEAYLVLPMINLDDMSEPRFKFVSAKSFWNHDGLSVVISSDFDGTNVGTATWETLNCNIASEDDANYAWINSGAINLSDYSGEVYLAFKYVGNGDGTATTTYAIDNVKVYEGISGVAGYNVYRGPCNGEAEDMVFKGFTLDQQFTDNTWGTAEAGIYKWAVEVVYDYNFSEFAYSNCLDKDMLTTVNVEVTTNSGDSPAETEVSFLNLEELFLVETELDETGMYTFEDFRKGTYDIYVHKNGFADIMLEGISIWDVTTFTWILEELLAPVSDLYVTPMGYATWGTGGDVPFESYYENFDEGLPETWMIDDGGSNALTWENVATYNGGSLDGTPFMFVDSDDAGSGGILLQESLISPIIENTEMASTLWLEWDQNFQWVSSTDYGSVQVFDGTDWVEILFLQEDDPSWPASTHHSIDVTEYANPDFQVKFYYDDDAAWAWYWGIDNFAVTEGEDRFADRELEYYKVWHDYSFITDADTTFYQYGDNGEVLVPGETYMAEVAAVYSTGMSAKMQYEWTYYPCDSFAGPAQFMANNVEATKDVLLQWSDILPMSLVSITQNPGAPVNGYYQSYDFGYGVVYDLSAYPDALASTIEFHHASWGVSGPHDYNIHIINWDTEEVLAELGPFTTTGDDQWEMDVNLGDVDLMGAANVAFLMEPLSNSAADAYPDLSSDDAADPQGSVYGSLSDIGAIGSSGIGNFLMNIGIMTANGPVRVSSTQLDIPVAPIATPRIGLGNIVTEAVITNQMATREVEDVFMGANLYRDGEMIAEMVMDTFYLDEALVPAYYDYCIKYVYESGAMSCGDCINNVMVPEDCDAPKNLTAMLDEETWDAIYLEWNGQEEVFITQNPGAPSNGYYQQYDYGYGVVYDLSAYPDALASSIEFHHASWGVSGPHDYNIHIINWDTEDVLAVLGPFTTTGDDLWEMNVPLDDVDLMGAANVAFLMEPLSNDAADAYPDLSSDDAADPQGSVYGSLSDIGSIASSGIGNFLMNIYIMTGYGESVLAPRVLDVPTNSTSVPRVGRNNIVNNPILNQIATFANNDREFTGFNIYRDGIVIEELWQETTYADTEGLENGNIYCYEVTAVYSICGESEPSNEACAGFVSIPDFDGSSVSLYPNPATSMVNISSSQELVKITVTNYVGQVVYQSDLNDATDVKLNTSSFENGVYVVRLDTKNAVVTKRVIIAQ